jgi:hypothetical protein
MVHHYLKCDVMVEFNSHITPCYYLYILTGCDLEEMCSLAYESSHTDHLNSTRTTYHIFCTQASIKSKYLIIRVATPYIRSHRHARMWLYMSCSKERILYQVRQKK